MRTIAIINQKGGCGKTTTSINLAACLARLGQKTLLLDMDPQGHCGVGLAVPEEQIERTIFDTLIEEGDGRVAKMSEIVWQIATDFDLAPSNLKLAAFEQLFAGRAGREDRLRGALAAIKATYQWVIIDCPPSVGLITFNALRAADEVIVPVETGFFSLHGLAKMMETLEHLRTQCDQELTIRVLPTLYDTRTKLAREVLSELRSKFAGYLMSSTINFNTKLKEAASFGQPITEYDPGSRGYKDFANLAKELMGSAAATIEQPIVSEHLSRPEELVQRAKQLQQLANVQFGRTTLATAAAKTEKKTTQQKIEEFYGVRQMGEQVVFNAKFPEAQSVVLAGDFNAWSTTATPLEAGEKPGQWTAKLPLKPGRYRYRLVVDGNWMTDPHNTYVEANSFGELNNIIEVD